MIAFGPVPSRRLGRSLGINNIPPKKCTYSCVYCQLGEADTTEIRRQRFRPAEEVVGAVVTKVDECRATGQPIDYLTFVPDGEPTLDAALSEEIQGLKPLGLPIAVITNGSLLWQSEVRADLSGADVVSVKVDATESAAWHRINRPARELRLDRILEGIEAFAATFRGELWTETMLVERFNDDPESLEGIATFLERLRPARSYLAVPTRPPALAIVRPPSEEVIVRAHEIFSGRLERVELLVTPEVGDFGRTGNPVDDLLAILAIHPMAEEEVLSYLKEAGESAEGVLATLEESGQAVRTMYLGRRFVARRLARRHGNGAK